MRDKVGEVEKAGVDWTNDCFRQLQREVSELRRREDKLNQLSQTEDAIQFLKVITVTAHNMFGGEMALHHPKNTILLHL